MSFKVVAKKARYNYQTGKQGDSVEKFKKEDAVDAVALFLNYLQDGYDVELTYKNKK